MLIWFVCGGLFWNLSGLTFDLFEHSGTKFVDLVIFGICTFCWFRLEFGGFGLGFGVGMGWRFE